MCIRKSAQKSSKRFFHVRSSAGSIGSNASMAVAVDAVRDLRPSYIIAGGICFGLDERKQNIADIVVSAAVKLYEPGKFINKREGLQFRDRGDRIPAGATLIDRTRILRREWKGCKIHDGLVVSGEKLVNANSFRNWLKQFEPEAIAGEMEAAGIFSAAERGRCEWILIKGIADWGKNKSDAHQREAAHNAFSFALGMVDLLPSAAPIL